MQKADNSTIKWDQVKIGFEWFRLCLVGGDEQKKRADSEFISLTTQKVFKV